MTKHRLYTDKNKTIGTFHKHSNFVGLQFNKRNDILNRFCEVVRKFLEEENLKAVSNNSSFTKHHTSRTTKEQFFDIYYKTLNSRTHKVEFKKLEKRYED